MICKFPPSKWKGRGIGTTWKEQPAEEHNCDRFRDMWDWAATISDEGAKNEVKTRNRITNISLKKIETLERLVHKLKENQDKRKANGNAQSRGTWKDGWWKYSWQIRVQGIIIWQRQQRNFARSVSCKEKPLTSDVDTQLSLLDPWARHFETIGMYTLRKRSTWRDPIRKSYWSHHNRNVPELVPHSSLPVH